MNNSKKEVRNMDEGIIIVAIAPFYAVGVVAVAYAASYSFHMLRRLDQSATETGMTETVPAK